MHPESILAITDFSVISDAVFARAAHLAAEHDATLTLVYAAPVGDQACPDAARRLSHHASQLGERYGIKVHAALHAADCLEDVLHAARSADIVVTGASQAGNATSFFCGRPEERILRATRRPVLVVQQKAGERQSAYRRLLVAVDFSDASQNLVANALVLGKSAEIELFHAICTDNERTMRLTEFSEHAIKAYKQAHRRHADDRLFWLTDSTDARRNRVGSAIGYGDPARQAIVQQQHSGADLVVVGKHPASALSDFVFGSVSRRVLQHASTDVLIIPHGFQFGTRALAVRRLKPEPPVARRRVRAGAP